MCFFPFCNDGQVMQCLAGFGFGASFIALTGFLYFISVPFSFLFSMIIR